MKTENSVSNKTYFTRIDMKTRIEEGTITEGF